MLLTLMRRCLLIGYCTAALAVHAQPSATTTKPLPPRVEAALAQAQIPREALSVLVLPVGSSTARLAWQEHTQRNPASVMKLVTTYAALELLGPAFSWQTPVYLDSAPQDGRLKGNVYIQGQGDPQLVAERLWLLMRRLQAQGVHRIEGDIVLDRSAFQLQAHDAAQFDGEPWRPYNVAPDALLVNFHAVTLSLVPDVAAGVARVSYDPPLADMRISPQVPLAPKGTACADWRSGLRADFAQPGRITLQGTYPAACGERQWPVAPADPQGYAARAIAGMWQAVGGQLAGHVRDGVVSPGLTPAFALRSPALSEIIRDINKYSNNVMTQQLLLTLALHKGGVGHFEAARSVLHAWWVSHGGQTTDLSVDNGAGLSRTARISAQALARMLQQAWASPVMPELLSSLPITGIDGTLRRRQGQARGAAHLKTGTLRDAAAIAGYVHADSGQRYVLVALVNHPQAAAARPALDALVDWVWADR